ncbi:TetR/AcrR family transcriptional regulator [Mycobacterium asiaticum]|uniref:TetR/AcrR family transcriptional regulator n=1 Tax=Mycobacterium asiaticum TaxID=1790 RepID=UPI0007EF1CE9|nr:TetR/AcrR family transcriptional regulator [Mycobacterium asiaticum]OBJ63536.1 hypothetical protein A9W94_10825 [Mycobacterium asiaticum]ORA18875.1 TetR family transcriptional regulator [Mycobacterium asiaticum DSM 44297]
MTPARSKPAGREAQRLETRERIFEAAIAEFKRNGMTGSDINSIAAAVGVARGTFYFHFPTKEHVAFELMRREEQSIVDDVRIALTNVSDIQALLRVVVRRVVEAEDQLGSLLFRDLLSIYFTANQLELGNVSEHPVAVLVIDELEKARRRGEVDRDLNAANTAKFFLLGVYGLLITSRDSPDVRNVVLDDYLTFFCRGLESGSTKPGHSQQPQ